MQGTQENPALNSTNYSTADLEMLNESQQSLQSLDENSTLEGSGCTFTLSASDIASGMDGGGFGFGGNSISMMTATITGSNAAVVSNSDNMEIETETAAVASTTTINSEAAVILSRHTSATMSSSNTMSSSAGDATAISSLSGDSLTNYCGNVPNHARRRLSSNLMMEPPQIILEEEEPSEDNSNRNNTHIQSNDDNDDDDDDNVSLSGKYLIERKLRREMSLNRRKLMVAAIRESKQNLMTAEEGEISIYDLDLGNSSSIPPHSPQNQSNIPLSPSMNMNMNVNMNMNNANMPHHRYHNSMPSSGFSFSPLLHVENDNATGHNSFVVEDEDDYGDEHDDTNDGNNDNQSLVSLSAKEMMEKKQRRESAAMWRRRAQREWFYANYHQNIKPPPPPPPSRATTTTTTTTTADDTTGTSNATITTIPLTTSSTTQLSSTALPATTTNTRPETVPPRRPPSPSTRTNDGINSVMMDDDHDDDESTLLSPIPTRSSSFLTWDRIQERQETRREVEEMLQRQKRQTNCRPPRRTFSDISSTSGRLSSAMTTSDDNSTIQSLSYHRHNSNFNIYQQQQQHQQQSSSNNNNNNNNNQTSGRTLSTVSEGNSGHFSVTTTESFRQQLLEQQIQHRRNCRPPRRTFSEASASRRSSFGSGHVSAITMGSDDFVLPPTAAASSTTSRVLSAGSGTTPSSHHFSVTTTDSFRQQLQQQHQQQRNPRHPKRTISAVSEAATSCHFSVNTTESFRLLQQQQQQQQQQRHGLAPQRTISAITDDEETSGHFSITTSDSFQQYQHQLQQRQQRNCRVPRRSRSATSMSLLSASGQRSVGTYESVDDEDTLSPISVSIPREKAQMALFMHLSSEAAHGNLRSLPLQEHPNEDDDTSHMDHLHNNSATIMSINNQNNSNSINNNSDNASISAKKMLEKKQRKEQRHVYHLHHPNIQVTLSRRNLLEKAKSVSHLEQQRTSSILEQRLRALPSKREDDDEIEQPDLLVQRARQRREHNKDELAAATFHDTISTRNNRRRSASGRLPGSTRSLSPMKSRNRWITGCRDKPKATGDVDSKDIGEWHWKSTTLDEKTLLFERSSPPSTAADGGLGMAPQTSHGDDHSSYNQNANYSSNGGGGLGPKKSSSTPNLLAMDDSTGSHQKPSGMGGASAGANANNSSHLHPAKIESLVSFLLGEGLDSIKKTIQAAEESRNYVNENASGGGVESKQQDAIRSCTNNKDSAKPPVTETREDEVPEKATVENDLPTTSPDDDELTEASSIILDSLPGDLEQQEDADADSAARSLAAIEENFEGLTYEAEEQMTLDSRSLMKKFKHQIKTGTRYLRKKAHSYVASDKDEVARLSQSMSAFDRHSSMTGAFHMEKLEELSDEEDIDEFAEDTVTSLMDKPVHDYTEENGQKQQQGKDGLGVQQQNKDVPGSRRGLLGFMRSASVPNISVNGESTKKLSSGLIWEQPFAEEKPTTEGAKAGIQKRKSKSPPLSPNITPSPKSVSSKITLSTSPKKKTTNRRTKTAKIPSIRNLDATDHSAIPAIKLKPPAGDTPKPSSVRRPSLENVDLFENEKTKQSNSKIEPGSTCDHKHHSKRKNATTEKRSSTSEKRRSTSEKRNSAIDKKSSSNEKSDKKNSSPEKRSSTGEKRLSVTEKRSRSKTRGEKSASRRSKSADKRHGSESAEKRQRSKERDTRELRSKSRDKRTSTHRSKSGERRNRSKSEEKRRRSKSAERRHRSKSASASASGRQRRESRRHESSIRKGSISGHGRDGVATKPAMKTTSTSKLHSSILTATTATSTMHSSVTGSITMHSSTTAPSIASLNRNEPDSSHSHDAMHAFVSSVHDMNRVTRREGGSGRHGFRFHDVDDSFRRSVSSRTGNSFTDAATTGVHQKQVRGDRRSLMSKTRESTSSREVNRPNSIGTEEGGSHVVSNRSSARRPQMRLSRQVNSERHLDNGYNSHLAASDGHNEEKDHSSTRSDRTKKSKRRSVSQGRSSSRRNLYAGSSKKQSDDPQLAESARQSKRFSSSTIATNSSAASGTSSLSRPRFPVSPTRVRHHRQHMGKSQSLRHMADSS